MQFACYRFRKVWQYNGIKPKSVPIILPSRDLITFEGPYWLIRMTGYLLPVGSLFEW